MIIKRIWAKLTNGKLVWLEDFDGDVTLTIARKHPFEGLLAQRMPFGIRPLQLLEDGSIRPNCYVKRWKYAD